jgi:hypothetical protein
VTDSAFHRVIPDSADREALNAALIATGAETGFWDDDGRPALWPDDFDEWVPCAGEPGVHEPLQPF